MSHPLPLLDLQRCLRQLITAPEATTPAARAAFAATVAELPVRGDARLGAAERVAIYARMYFARIREAIAEDYPGLRAALGDAGFDRLIRAYLADHPPADASLRRAARDLADFAARRPDLAPAPWHAPLARFEAAMVEVFDAVDEATLGVADLATLPADRWPGLVVRPVRAVRQLDPLFAVDEARERLLRGEPGEPVAPLADPLRVWRQAYVAYYRRIPRREAEALERIAGGAPFAELCAWLDGRVEAEAPAQAAVDLLHTWLADEILVRTLPPDEASRPA